ncbi:hypothetical protein Tco_0992565 [Tanacetum coccineum]|uniref:Synaptobrevin, longin-like domain protein n=1 Tax=Tanacetum coccineum TaxID=301880 RepID=A0ABQ5F2F3_9ASTR
MVACLEKSEGNADFHEIVDFLTASSVHYALTVSPTIYASYIEQFWNTAHSQTVNDVKQIHATVDGKTVVISESSVRSDLHFNDEDGITCLTNDAIFENLALMGYESDSNKLTFQKALFSPQWKYLIHTILHCLSSKSTSWNEFSTNIASAVICLANGQKFNFSKLIFDGMLRNLDTNTKKFLMYPRFLQLFLNNQITLAEPFNDVYQTPAHTKKVFTNMKRKGKDFSGRVTPLFASMLAPPVVEGEGSGQPSEPQPAPSTAQPRIEEQIPEWDDKVARATTTATSLDVAHASGNISKTQSMAMSNDPFSQEIGSGDRPRCQEAIGVSLLRIGLRGGHTPGSDEGRPNINELMAIYTNLSNRVLALEQSKTAQDLVIRKLKKKVKKLEKKLRARTLGMKLFKIGTSKRKSLDKEYVSKQGRKSDKTKPMFDDSNFVKLDVDNAMENVEGDAETQGRNIAEQITIVNVASINVSGAGPSNVSTDDPSTSTAGDIFEDEMMTITDTLVAIRSTRPRTTSVIIHDVEEEPRRSTLAPTTQPSSKDKGKALMVEPEKPSKNPRKAQIQMDEELAIRLHEEEKAELERMQRERATQEEASNAALIAEFDNVQARMEADALLAARLQEKEREQFSIDEQARFLVETIAERKRFFAAQRAKQIRNKPPTKIQLRNKMITYLKNIGRFTYNQLKNKSFKEIQKLYEKEQKWIKDFIPMDYKEGGKKATSSKKRPRAKPDEESVKRQKIRETSDQEVYFEDIRRYWRIIRVGNHIEAYQIFADMLKKFDRDDLVKLWDLVKKRFSTTEPTDDKEKELWVELKRLFEPNNDDILWKFQRYMHDPLVWRLYDTCGVHYVSSVRGHDIFMLVEKEYPLTRGPLGLMMVARLLVKSDSEMSRELLRKIFYQANIPRQ